MLSVGGLAMHIPDGFLSIPVSIIFWLLSAGIIAIALRRVNKHLGEREVPLMGVLAASIFAGQMLNFAVAGGTSGHLLGAAIASILLGPWAAMVVMTCVVSVQALIFQDGGLVVLGANLFNMAIIGVAVAYTVYRTIYRLSGGRKWGIFAGGFLSAWFSIVISSLSAGFQLALSGTSPANVAIPAMASVHALIGIGEGLITLGALAFLYSARRDLLMFTDTQSSSSRAIWIGGFAMALILAIASPLASKHPDGLEWVAQQHGFANVQQAPLYRLIPHYLIPGVTNPHIATVVAGMIGAILVMAIAYLVAASRRRKTQGTD